MTEQLAIERNAVMGDMEIEKMQLERELKDLNEKMLWWEDACKKSVEREKNLSKRLYLSDEQRDLEILWREHLDQTDPEDDNEQEAAARQILWNDKDTEKQRAAEESVPF